MAIRRPFGRPALALAVLLAVTGCGTSAAGAGPEPTPTPGRLTVEDPWVKAADSGMTAAFGTLVNGTGAPVTVESATSSVSVVELHEMVMADGQMKMQPKAGGFTVEAGGRHELAPGGDHLMLMEIAEPVRAGDEVTVTLTLDNGQTVQFTALARPFAAANESYQPTSPPMDMGSTAATGTP